MSRQQLRSDSPPPMALNRSIGGKRGYLHLGFERDPLDGKTILRSLDRRAPMVVQQALYWDEQLPQMACVYTLSSGGPLVDGDRYDCRVHLSCGAEAHISSGASTLIASMNHDCVEIERSATLAAHSYLEWLPESTIPCRRSRSRSTTRIVVDPTASLFWAEQFCCGRLHYGELFDFEQFSQQTIVAREDGRVLLRESARITPSEFTPLRGGILGGFTHWATIYIVAPRPVVEALYKATKPHYHSRHALGISLLAASEGVVVRILGYSAEELKADVRTLCGEFRRIVKGVPMDAEFPWR